jgi:hypothetical protein
MRMNGPDAEVFRYIVGLDRGKQMYAVNTYVSIVGQSFTWWRPAVGVASYEAILFTVYFSWTKLILQLTKL